MTEPKYLTKTKNHPESICHKCNFIKENCEWKMKVVFNAKKIDKMTGWKVMIKSCSKKEY